MQWSAVRLHPLAALVILHFLTGVLERSIRHGELLKALAYLGAKLLCTVIIDLFAE
ncbi:MAG: hypothetical protein JNN32_11580 [Flavobacteriales bacterium]|nr:hypothetical protein [Flavobacteriales bacterium]